MPLISIRNESSQDDMQNRMVHAEKRRETAKVLSRFLFLFRDASTLLKLFRQSARGNKVPFGDLI